MIFAGIDPGQSGVLAIVSADLQTAEAWDYPGSIEAAADLLRGVYLEYKPVLTAIEKVGAMPKQGVSSTFKFGINYGAWLGALSALQVPFITITPAKWQREILDAGTGETKNRSLSMARRLFPDVDLSRKKDHGKSDALLLALYAARWHQQMFVNQCQPSVN